MITVEDIDATEFEIAEIISAKYRNNEMSAYDLGNRLKFLHEYTKVMKRALVNMRNMESGL